MANGRDPIAVTLQASAAQSTNGNGAAVQLVNASVAPAPSAPHSVVDLFVDCTAASGTGSPTLTVNVEHSPNGVDGWTTLASVTVTAVGVQEIVVGGSLPFVRARWTITGGTPSFTFSVSGTAQISYVDPADLYDLALPTGTLQAVTPRQLAKWCLAASDEADMYLNEHFTFPLVSWPFDLRRHCASMLAMIGMRMRGYRPDSNRDPFKDAYDQAIAWMKYVAQNGHPAIVDSSPLIDEGSSMAGGDVDRGWKPMVW